MNGDLEKVRSALNSMIRYLAMLIIAISTIFSIVLWDMRRDIDNLEKGLVEIHNKVVD